MLALVFDGEAVLRKDYPAPKVGEDEALVGVHTAGVCSTDLEMLKGYMDFRGVLGHEFVGHVVEGPKGWQGKRVVAQINCVCGRCRMCKSGLSNHCPNRTVIGIDGRDGVFAEYVSLPVGNLHEVPVAVSDTEAVFVEPLAAAFQIARQVRFAPSDRVVVLGDGRLGQLIVRVLRLHVSELVLVGKHPSKMEAAQKVGADTVALADFRPSAEADVVVDATGSPSGLELAMRAVRPRGTIVLKSTYADRGACNLAPVVIGEITIVGSRCGPFADAIDALAHRRVDVSGLVSDRFALSEAVCALRTANKPDSIKVLIDVGC